MIKYECDFCGKTINDLDRRIWDLPIKQWWAGELYYKSKSYDMCPQCLSKIADFVKELKNEKGTD